MRTKAEQSDQMTAGYFVRNWQMWIAIGTMLATAAAAWSSLQVKVNAIVEDRAKVGPEWNQWRTDVDKDRNQIRTKVEDISADTHWMRENWDRRK